MIDVSAMKRINDAINLGREHERELDTPRIKRPAPGLGEKLLAARERKVWDAILRLRFEYR